MRRCASQPLVRRAAPTPSSSPRTKSVRASSGTGASDGELLGLADPVPVGVPLGVAVELVGTAPSGGDTAGVDVVEPAAGPAEPEEPVAADAPVSAVARGTPVLSSIPHLLRLPLPAPPRTVGGTPAPSGGLAQPAKSLILLVPAGWGDVEEFGDLGDGFAAGPDVAHGGAGVAVPGLGHDQLEGNAVLAEVGGCGVAELVQYPAGVLAEQHPGAVVAEPGSSGAGAQVLGAGPAGRAGAAFGEEHRAGFAAADEAGQQVGGAGAPVDPFGVAALGADRCAAGVQVEVVDVQCQDLAGAGGGLIQQPPQGLLPQRHVLAGQLPLDRGPLERPGLVGVLRSPLQRGRHRRCGVPVLGAPGQPGADR